MSTTTYRRVGKTGRPLGMLDVLSKIVDTAAAGLTAWVATRRVERQRAAASSEAAAVRCLADGYRRADPGVAADLYAAADRHELQQHA